MPEHVPFHSIDQFRNTVKLVRERAQHDGVPLPSITFVGTVKLHGTNASVGWSTDGEQFVQSRSQIITPEADNAGFAAYVRDNQEVFDSFSAPGRIIFGEWCGGSIQKGVALNKLPKMFVVFAVKEGDVWMPREHVGALLRGKVRSVFEAETWTMRIDFSAPELSQNKLGEITQQVEAECPFGILHNVSGIGEGVVWTAIPEPGFNCSGLTFKVKGEKHSETKVRTLAAVDVEKIANIRILVDSILPSTRLTQCLEKMRVDGYDPTDVRNTGVFLKKTAQDVLKEEKDTIEASGLPLPEVMKRVAGVAKQFYMESL